MILDKKEKIECVFANRFDNGFLKYTVWDFGNYLFTKLFNFIHKSNVKDALCCAKAFYISNLEIGKLSGKRFDIDVEILSKLVKLKPRIKNINVKYQRRDRKEGKKLKLKDSLGILLRIIYRN